MTKDEIRSKVVRMLTEIAPECDPATLKPDTNLRDQLDLDSMDYQSFIIRLHEEFQVEVPERDYPKFATIASATDYLVAKSGK
jgi:acyl carrier protein